MPPHTSAPEKLTASLYTHGRKNAEHAFDFRALKIDLDLIFCVAAPMAAAAFKVCSSSDASNGQISNDTKF